MIRFKVRDNWHSFMADLKVDRVVIEPEDVTLYFKERDAYGESWSYREFEWNSQTRRRLVALLFGHRLAFWSEERKAEGRVVARKG